MGKTVSASSQKAAAESMASALSSMDGVSAEVSERTGGTNPPTRDRRARRTDACAEQDKDGKRVSTTCVRIEDGC